MDNRVQMFGNHLEGVPAFAQEFKGDAKTTEMFRNTVFSASQDHVVLEEGRLNTTLTLTSPVVNGPVHYG